MKPVANCRSNLNTPFEHLKWAWQGRRRVKNSYFNLDIVTHLDGSPTCRTKMGVAATPFDRSGRAIRLWIPEIITVNPYGHVQVATVNRLAVIVKNA